MTAVGILAFVLGLIVGVALSETRLMRYGISSGKVLPDRSWPLSPPVSRMGGGYTPTRKLRGEPSRDLDKAPSMPEPEGSADIPYQR